MTLSNETKAYIAGFLDGDGSILAQIVKNKTYKYGFTIRCSVNFYQHKKNSWIILWLKKELKKGNIRIRNNIIEYSIVDKNSIKRILYLLIPYLKIKKPLAKLIIKIIDEKENVQTKADFLKVCNLVDKVAKYTYSKKRKVTSSVVKKSWNLPVETIK